MRIGKLRVSWGDPKFLPLVPLYDVYKLTPEQVAERLIMRDEQLEEFIHRGCKP